MLNIQLDALLAVLSFGTYGFVMSSNYNTSSGAAGVIINHYTAYGARKHESLES